MTPAVALWLAVGAMGMSIAIRVRHGAWSFDAENNPPMPVWVMVLALVALGFAGWGLWLLYVGW